MNNVYVLGGMRSPIVTQKNKFKHISAERLGAEVVKALCEKYSIQDIDGIIGGNAVGTGGNITRLMALQAGISDKVPAFTIDMQCASGAAAIATAYSQLAIGNGDLYLCGGMESASLQPQRIYSINDTRYSQTANKDGRYMTAQFVPDELGEDVMLRGADRTIKAENITRGELDFWCIRSHRKAVECAELHILDDVIVPVAGQSRDDGLRPKMSRKLLDRLPALLPNSLLTAGNTCLINDGAAFVVLVSEKWLEEHPHHIPLGKIEGVCMAGSNPMESPRGAMNTADILLARNELNYSDMAAIEFNEAFAVIDVLFQRKHPKLIDRYNQLGGALAYGHPYGASGGILMIHLLKALEKKPGSWGIMSIAGAGGMGQSILIKNL